MPELPEVETTKNGIQDAITGQKVQQVIIRQPKLRWLIPGDLPALLKNQKLLGIQRRAKYLLFSFANGTMLLHLGMSGKLRILKRKVEPQKHDHVDIVFSNGVTLRYNDPRRFGCVLWCSGDLCEHKLIKHLGPEPLERSFNPAYLNHACKKRKAPIKQVIMDAKVVVGVGNIYACEALLLSHIHPLTPANSLSLDNYANLCKKIKIVLRKSIKAGGTTLKDFKKADGNPGYFQQKLNVYGRDGKSCQLCQKPIHKIVQAGRSTFFCPCCQTL